ncbi:MAG: 16S rRNA (guanine(966)-N(2))-methyltransferase RsmD [Spirochaetota bacterium]|nr:16S rRNA (guanine(966)-N(2))-methyltransferase RsmD [Spirochaetota bacterium]
MKVNAGSFKRKEIYFTNKKFNNADVTPQKVKEALFSVLGENLYKKSFLDLYACSGQIGIEALSRGASNVVFNEIDKKRYNFIKSIIKEWKLEDRTLVLRFHAFKCLKFLISKGLYFDFIFIDPPYEKIKGDVKLYYDILNEIDKCSILNRNAVVIIQHFSNNSFKQKPGSFRILETKKYANNSLSFFIKK